MEHYVLLLIILFIEAIIDYKTYNVYTHINILIAILGIIFNENDILTIILIPSIILVTNLIIKGMGFGDIEILYSIAFWFNIKQQLDILLFATIINLLFALISRKNKYPFVPFIFIGCLIEYCIIHQI